MPAPAAAAIEASADDLPPQLPRKRRRLHEIFDLPSTVQHCRAQRAASGDSHDPAPAMCKAFGGSTAEAGNCSVGNTVPHLPSNRVECPRNGPNHPDQQQQPVARPPDQPRGARCRDHGMLGSNVHGDPPCYSWGLSSEGHEAAQQHGNPRHRHKQASVETRKRLGDADLALLARLGAPLKPLPPEGIPQTGLRPQGIIDGLSRRQTAHMPAGSNDAEAALQLPLPDGQCSQLEVIVCLATLIQQSVHLTLPTLPLTLNADL